MDSDDIQELETTYDDVGLDNLEENEVGVGQQAKGRPKKGRKRKFPDQGRADKKLRRNSNEFYYTENKKEVHPKEFKEY